MLNFTNFFKQSPQNKLSLKNNTQLAYKGSWVQIYPDTEIDRWYVGDYSSANYTITAEFDSNKKEVLQVLVVARPDQATVTVYGRTSIDDSLINISASVNNSYVSIIVNVTDTTFLGTKVIFFANYAETITPLSVAQGTSFIDSSLGGGYDGGGGSIGAAASFSQLSGTIGLSQISNGLITPAKLNLNASLIPTANETYDLGSNTFRWRDLYLSGSSIQLGSATITASGSSIVLPVGTTVGGTAINSFSTVAVSGQTSVVADSADDTLTLVAGPGIELTTNVGTDTVTITNTGGGGGGASGVSSGTATRLAYYASTGSVVQDTGVNLTWSGTTLAVTGSISASSAITVNGSNVLTAASLPNTFSTISVAGQTSVVADTTSDTLTLVGAGGVTITTNATTDTITITGSGGGTLDALSDVVITAPSTNQVLKYDGSNWINGTDATGGGGATSDSFTIIAVAGQSNVVADSSTDTLTFVNGTGISITTNATTDTITIASTVAAGATAFTGLSDRSDLTVDQFYLPAITRLVVTANGFSAYRFDQYGTADDPTIYAISGTTIAFDLNALTSPSHPFLIRFSGANYDTGLVHVTAGGVVTTGSSAQGKTSGTLYWKIPAGISGTYGYLCGNHGLMIGTITVKDISAI